MMRTVDNAHNNYLQVLCSMGAAGLAAYTYMIASAAWVCFKNIFVTANTERGSKLVFAALLASIGGYSVYGLTNFDDTVMLFGLFILLMLIRAFDLNSKKEKKFLSAGKSGTLIIAFLLLIFFGYNAYVYTNKVTADHHFLNGEMLMKEKKYKQGIGGLNAAVTEEPGNPAYRLILASEVYEMVISNRSIEPASKKDLLRQAADEVLKARVNYFNVNLCDALLAMIYFESGRDSEAEELVKKALAADEINFRFRMNLARYFLNKGKYDRADEQLAAIEKTGYLGIDLALARAEYYMLKGDYAESVKKLDMVLSRDPYNRDAVEMKKQAEEKLKTQLPLNK